MRSALRSDPHAGTVWRLVEAQHVVSTMRLVDDLTEQAILERLLERSKPAVPPECGHLHYLLATPFRYGAYPASSRFRRKGRSPGVYYASEAIPTAMAETVWWRHQFYEASAGGVRPAGAGEYSAIAARVATAASVDLTSAPYAARSAERTDPSDYTACLDLADRARAEGIGCIRYESVRDPDRGANLAVLTCASFAMPDPVEVQGWRILLRSDRAVAYRDWPREEMEFRLTAPRLSPG
jgi:hypothetical protein